LEPKKQSYFKTLKPAVTNPCEDFEPHFPSASKNYLRKNYGVYLNHPKQPLVKEWLASRKKRKVKFDDSYGEREFAFTKEKTTITIPELSVEKKKVDR